jgi:hypothetical protein
MWNKFMDTLWGCSHRRTTFPITPARRPAFSSAAGIARLGTYVVCLDCGKEFAYSWSEMRIGEAVSAPVTAEATFSTVQRSA